MGLDSVELLFEIEEKFGIEITDLEAEQIYTVGDFVDTVYRKIKIVPDRKCLTQIVFYRIKKALESMGIIREEVTPDSKLSELLIKENIKVAWEKLENEVKLTFPELVRMDVNKKLTQEVKLLGIRIYNRTEPVTDQTIRKLIDWIISLNFDQLVDINQISNKYEVERVVAGIISARLGVPINEIELKHSITNDLGID